MRPPQTPREVRELAARWRRRTLPRDERDEALRLICGWALERGLRDVDSAVLGHVRRLRRGVHDPGLKPSTRANARQQLVQLVVPPAPPGRPAGSRSEDNIRQDRAIWLRMEGRKYAEWRKSCGSKTACFAELPMLLEQEGLAEKRPRPGTVKQRYQRMRERKNRGLTPVNRPAGG